MLVRLRSPWVWGPLALIAVIIVVFVVIASGGGEDEGDELLDISRGPDVPIVIPPDEPVIVGVSTALTGPIGDQGSEYLDAVFSGIEHWRETNGDSIGGHEIEVRAEDDGCSEADITVTAARRHLGRAGLVGVIGPMCSSGAAAALPIYAEAGVVAISGSVTRVDLTTGQSPDGFFFRTAYRNDLEGTFIALFLASQEADLVYLINADDLFSMDLANYVQQDLRVAGITTIREGIKAGDVDFSALAARIATDSPDFVGFAGFNPEAGLLLRQIRDAGYDGLFGAGDAAASQQNFADPLGEAAEGALFAGCQFPLSGHFLADFVDLHGEAPQATFPGQYADAAIVLLDAVKQVAEEQEDGSLTILPTALRDAVRATVIDEGFTGSFTFDVNGDRVPEPGDLLSDVQEAAFATQDEAPEGAATEEAEAAAAAELEQALVDLGLIQCQVQDGQIVPVSGPTEREVRF